MWSERNNALLYLACTESSLLGGDFKVQFQQYLPTPPFLTTSNRVLLFEKKKNDLCSLYWLINFRLTVLIPYHAHVGTYAIHFYISHDISF